MSYLGRYDRRSRSTCTSTFFIFFQKSINLGTAWKTMVSATKTAAMRVAQSDMSDRTGQSFSKSTIFSKTADRRATALPLNSNCLFNIWT